MNEDPESSRLDIALVVHDPAWREAAWRQSAGRDSTGHDSTGHDSTGHDSTLGTVARLRRAARLTFARAPRSAGFAGPVEISVVLADDALLRSLNRDYRQRDEPTNVLSFEAALGEVPIPGEALLLGDIVLARETIAREAAEQAKPFVDHLTHLVIHGALHLLGYDHQINREAREMEALEVAILSDLGIADPYLERAEPDRAGARHGVPAG